MDIEVFRVKSGFYRSTGRLPEPPRELYGPKWALVEKKGQPKMGRAPLPSLGLNRTRRGGRPPSQFGLGLGGRPLPCSFPLLSTKAQ